MIESLALKTSFVTDRIRTESILGWLGSLGSLWRLGFYSWFFFVEWEMIELQQWA